MIDREGETFVFAVAQQPWEDDKNENNISLFSALIPAVSCEDSTRAEPSDFPYNGQVWWKLFPHSRSFAVPGNLVTAKLTLSMYANTPGKDHYQVVPESVEMNVDKYFRHIVKVDLPTVLEPKHLLSSKNSIELPYAPVRRFWVQWRDSFIGPFQTRSLRGNVDTGWTFNLATANVDGSVFQFPTGVLSRVQPYKQHDIELKVSRNNYAYYQTTVPLKCRYRLIDAQAFDEAIPSDAKRLLLESDEAVLRRLSKSIVGRTKKRQFNELASELLPYLSATEEVASSDIELLREMRDTLDRQAEAAASLASAIIDTGLLSDQIAAAEQLAARDYVERNATALQANIDEKIKDLRQLQKDLEQSCQKLNAEIASQRKQGLKSVEREMGILRAEKQKELDTIQADIEQQKRDLSNHRNALHEAAQSLIENRQSFINQFLAITPLLEQFGLLPSKGLLSIEAEQRAKPNARSEAEGPFPLPEFVIVDSATDAISVKEEEFLERFRTHAENSGFRYRDVDRLSFHTSVKCGDITIVGGPPGTGKSSLVRLYAESLLGSSSEIEGQRFLHVPVSPSWLDVRDVLGHINSLEGKFQPSESGIFQFLIWANEELRNQQNNSGMYVACLDEMNLSHVEHYFSSFIQVLEQPIGKRILQCFPDNVVSSTSQFQKWSKIELSPNVRFVGTVNFDETTKQLSQRLLDRANLVRLVGDRPTTDLLGPKSVAATGPKITFGNFSSWVRQSDGLLPSVARLVDDLRDPLRKLGCPLNPRTFTAIQKFLANYPEDDIATAIDLQLTQRVFSKLRSLFRPGVTDALADVLRILEAHEFEFLVTRRMLAELRETEIYGSFVDLDLNK